MIFRSDLPDIEIPTEGIYQYVTGNPNGIPDTKPIFIDGTSARKVTFGELKSNTKRFAAGLQDKLGFKRDDVLAIFSPNQVDYATVLLGTIAAGGKVTLANQLDKEKELLFQLTDSSATVLVVHSECLEVATRAASAANIPLSRILLFGGKEVNGFRPYTDLLGSREAEPVTYTPEQVKDQTAYICYSSGLSGKFKGVETTHRNMVANIAQYLEFEGDSTNSDAVYMGFLPFSHMYGLNILVHIVPRSGASIVVIPRFDLSLFYRAVQEHKVTTAHIVPPIVLLMVKDPTVKQYDLSSLRLLISGAAPLSKELSDNLTRVHNIPIKQGYGLTETSPVTHLCLTDDIVNGSIGKLLPNIEAKIVSEDGVELGHNKPGELWLRGPNVMKGYLNNIEATAESIDSDGFLHTGDVVKVDEKGFFFIVDRLKEVIKHRGHQVPPAELEEILSTHQDVADCSVIGVWFELEATELPVAYVVLKPGCKKSNTLRGQIKGFVEERVAPYKKLRDVAFIDEIPKNASGKILRHHLKERAKSDFVLNESFL